MTQAAMGGSSSSHFLKNKKKFQKRNLMNRVAFVSASATATTFADPYQTLSLHRDASESEVKKAFRRLALKVIFASSALILSFFGSYFGRFQQ